VPGTFHEPSGELPGTFAFPFSYLPGASRIALLDASPAAAESHSCRLRHRRRVVTYGQVFSALIFVGLALLAWAWVRRRSARVGAAVLVVGALLVLGCFVPAEALTTRSRVHGTLTGDARIPIVGGTTAVNATLDGGMLVVSCASACAFSVEDASFALQAGDLLAVTLHGGPLDVQQDQSVCHVEPLTLRALTLGDTCDPCQHLRFEAAAESNGTVVMKGASGPC
jgi:hypothetical protein